MRKLMSKSMSLTFFRPATYSLPLLLALAGPVRAADTASPTDGPLDEAATSKQSAISEVIVLGTGQSRQMQTVAPIELAKPVPGTSPLETLSKLPGVDFQSSDPLGEYEWAQQITIRGFTTEQLGFTLDGVPLGNMEYRNNNGLSIGRALQTENNGPVTLSQGSGALGTASTSNIGGTIEFSSIDPTTNFGVDVAQTYGNNDTLHSFIRINSGLLPGDGRFYVSYDHQDADKWKGYGSQEQDQINLKLIQPITSDVTSTTFVDLVDRHEDDYQDVSLDLVHRLGYDVDYISNNYPLAEALARSLQNGTPVPAPYTYADDTFYDSGEVRQDLLAYEKLAYELTPQLSGQTTAYMHLDHGLGTFGDSYDPTPAADGGSPLSVSTVGYRIEREGAISRLSYELDGHTIAAGFWFEHTKFDQIAQLFPLQANVPPTDFEQFYSNPFDTLWDYVFTTNSYQFDIGDTWKVSDKLRLNAGFKSLVAESTARTIVSSQPINGSIRAADDFLPAVGALYSFDQHNEMFADYTGNMATFEASAANGPFSTTQAGFDYIQGNLKPEKTNTGETGYRYHDDSLQASVTGYYVRFENRLLASSISSVIVGNQNVLENVGSVTSNGVEAAVNWKFAPAWSIYGTWSYNHAYYDDNVVVPDSGTVVATEGKQVVASPRNLGNLQLSHDDGSSWGQLSAHYHDRRYYTYSNDAPIGGATILDFAAGYRFHSQNWLDGAELMVDVTNLLDKRYYASIGTSGFVDSDPSGTYQTLQVGAPRMEFITLRKHF
jgi:iron complex outermembrane recepter protein